MNKNLNAKVFTPYALHLAPYTLIIIVFLFFTSLAWSATISGKVEIEGRKDLSGVLITVQERSLSGITESDGTYSIPDVPPGSYTLIAQKTGCIVVVRSDVIVGSGTIPSENFQMPAFAKASAGAFACQAPAE